MAHAVGQGLQERVGERRDDGEEQPAVERGGLPLFPPGPDDAEAWEAVLKVRSDLAPAIDGKLNPRFVEWLQGFPIGWTEVEGVSRRQRLKVLGNAVVPQCAERALRMFDVA
jgi:site-specific DNA-cytosine methylase